MWPLSWLRNWWRNRQRAIFHYWDGKRNRRIDPMVVYRRLDEHPEFDWDNDTKLFANIGDERKMLRDAAEEAMQKCIAATREAFAVSAFDSVSGCGLTEMETLSLFESFCVYMGVLKKSTGTLPTSPQFTDSVSESATKNTSDSGSISTASRGDSQAL